MRIPVSWSKCAAILVAIILLYWLSRHDYLLFHMTIEVFSAVVAGCMFILTLTLVNTSLSTLSLDFPAFFVIIGCGQGAVALLTLLHMAAYKGMQILGTNDANLATQLWIAARLLETGTLFIAVLQIGKTIAIRRVLETFAVLTGALLASIFIWPVFPDCFIDGVGLTPFKIAMEYMMMGVLAWTLWRLHSRRDFFSAAVLRRLEAAYVLHIAGGMFFTLYADVYGLTNVLGHLMFFGSYLLIADSLVRHMIQEPQAIWFRDLYASEVKFRSLTESSPDYIMRFDRQCRHTYVNPAGLQVTGRTAAEMLGKTPAETGLAADLCSFWQERIFQVFDTASPSHTEFEWNSPNGLVVFDLRLTPEFDAEGQVISVLSVARDITERKQAEGLLRRNAETQAILREIAEAASLEIHLDELYPVVHKLIKQIFPSQNFNIALLNDVTGQIVTAYCVDETGVIPRQRPVGRYMTEYVIQQRQAMHVTAAEFDRLRQTGEVDSRFVEFKEWIGAPLCDSQGKIFGVITLLTLSDEQSFQPEDVKILSIIAAQVAMAIERKRTEVELASLYLQSEAASQAKSTFLANMSHELRTPLNAIIGFSEVLKKQMFGQLNRKQEEYVDHVLVSGRHLLSLVSDILDLSKAEAGKIELEKSWISISEICLTSFDMLRAKATQRQVRLSLALDDSVDGLAVFADGRKLRQILVNLIDNGIKYNKPAGSLTVTVTKIDREAKPAAIQIVVEDTGIGISRDNLALLFKPFGQLSRIHTEPTEGTGLGLALTKHLVELHGGEIHVESELGVGSRFIVWIPMQEGYCA